MNTVTESQHELNGVPVYQFVLQEFHGNSGRNDIVKHSLEKYASARFIRFQPTNHKNRKALRVEVFGILISAGIIFTY